MAEEARLEDDPHRQAWTARRQRREPGLVVVNLRPLLRLVVRLKSGELAAGEVAPQRRAAEAGPILGPQLFLTDRARGDLQQAAPIKGVGLAVASPFAGRLV